MMESSDLNQQCLIVMRQFTKVPRADKSLPDFICQDQDSRARLDRLRDRLTAVLRPDRILKYEVPYISGTNAKAHQGYLTSVIEQVRDWCACEQLK